MKQSKHLDIEKLHVAHVITEESKINLKSTNSSNEESFNLNDDFQKRNYDMIRC